VPDPQLCNAGSPTESGCPVYLAELRDTPEYRLWNAGVVHVRGCDIVPGSAYQVRAVRGDANPHSDPLLVATAGFSPAGPPSCPADHEAELEALADLQSLQVEGFVHIGAGIRLAHLEHARNPSPNVDYDETWAARLMEYIRITGYGTVNLRMPEEDLEAAFKTLCWLVASVNSDTPGTNARLAVYETPWGGTKVSETDELTWPTNLGYPYPPGCGDGVRHNSEIAVIAARFHNVNTWMADFNNHLTECRDNGNCSYELPSPSTYPGPNLSVLLPPVPDLHFGAILLDSEAWRTTDSPPPNPDCNITSYCVNQNSWNCAIRIKHDALLDLIRQYFDDTVYVERYDRYSGTAVGALYTGEEVEAPYSGDGPDSASQHIYNTPNPDKMIHSLYNCTNQLSAAGEVGDFDSDGDIDGALITPWIALGSAYSPTRLDSVCCPPPIPDIPGACLIKDSYFDYRYDYPLEFSRRLGAWVNDPNAAGDDAAKRAFGRLSKHVVFWPHPFHELTVGGWARHFIAYAKGFLGEDELEIDCNQSHVADVFDIALGASDCNLNSIPDECDLVSGTSCDLDDNGWLDECGACCGESHTCRETIAGDCAGASDVFVPERSCDEAPCNPAACCAPNGCHEAVPEFACQTLGGYWLGNRSPATVVCGENCDAGVCCAASGCQQMSAAACASGGGSYHPGGRCTDDDVCGPGENTDPDFDNDCVPNAADNCPESWNPAQADQEPDGIGDACDNCPSTPNAEQEDWEGDGIGDACDQIHVAWSAIPFGDGKTWETAFKKLDDALSTEQVEGREIWVREGTYTSPGGDGFVVPEGVRLLGGFGEDENETDAEQRDPATHVTVLDGHNSSRVLTVPGGNTVSPIIDGFTITGGRDVAGGGMSAYGPVTVINSLFVNNHATEGGAVKASGQVRLINCSFHGNSAIRHGGAVFMSDQISTARNLLNCTVVDNIAGEYGGGVYVENGAFRIDNSILWANTAAGESTELAQIRGGTSNPTIQVYHSCIQDEQEDNDVPFNNTNIDRDPRLVNMRGDDGLSATGDEDLRLRFGSPCLDIADNAELIGSTACFEGCQNARNCELWSNGLCRLKVDLRGVFRRQDDPCTGDPPGATEPVVDMGAYEYAPDPDDWDGDGVANGADCCPCASNSDQPCQDYDGDGTNDDCQYTGELDLVVKLDVPYPAGGFSRSGVVHLADCGGEYRVTIPQLFEYQGGGETATTGTIHLRYLNTAANRIAVKDSHTVGRMKVLTTWPSEPLMFNGDDTLPSGNAYLGSAGIQDSGCVINILDLALWVTHNLTLTANFADPCKLTSPPCVAPDFNADGVIDLLDFSFISINFYKKDEWQDQTNDVCDSANNDNICGN
jgi:hypothetical protein